MKQFGLAVLFLLAVGGFWSSSANATIASGPLPSSAYITYNGSDWAWADPCAAVGGCADIDLSGEAQYGWMIPTATQMLNAPSALMFLFPGANVPLGGNDPVSGASFQYTGPLLTSSAACATPYFNNSYAHCDWGNGVGSGGTDGAGNGELPWYNQPGYLGYSETLLIRSGSPVPEPAAFLLLGTALAGLGLVRRR